MGIQKILSIHNYYQQPGGEDRVFESESRLLTENHYRVYQYVKDNDSISGMRKVDLALSTFWNQKVYKELTELIRKEQPQIAHFHNFFPLISPAAYYAVKAQRIPVVQTLHNYRLMCPNALFYRDDHICEDCLNKFFPWPGILHTCYRDDVAASSVIAGMLAYHRARNTWHTMVDAFIVLSEFSRQKFIQGGLPAERIFVKPNFIYPDPGARETPGKYALFFGRLSTEKGPMVLLKAWEKLPGIPLKIIGNGPLFNDIEKFIKQHKMENVQLLGQLPHEHVIALIKEAKVAIFPSVCYENFPVGVIEAYACGIPVIASKIGMLNEIIEEQTSGLFFNSGDVEDLAYQVDWAISHPDALAQMGVEARQEYLRKYTAAQNLNKIIEIYEKTASRAH